MNKINPHAVVRNAFNGQRRLRSWKNSHFGGMKAVKSHPLSICRFRPDEGGTISTNLNVRLAPVSGYMRTKAYAEVVQIAVPYQAIEKLQLDTQEDAGVTEMTRRRLMAGQGIGLEDESEITKAANIHPLPVGTDKRVSKTARLAYLAAVNHLRLHAYFAADLCEKSWQGIQAAVLSANALQRFNGVLDPERLIDGAINLTGDLPVTGVTRQTVDNQGLGDASIVADTDGVTLVHGPSGTPEMRIENELTADMSTASELTLRDMIESQKLDGLIRSFAQMIQDDPVNGEERVERALYGISVDYDHNCQVLYRKTFELSPMHQRPTDGASINDVSANFELDTRFSTVVPRSELGLQVVTLVMIKPLETISKQPDPAQTEAWGLVNRIHDETELDEVLLTRGQLESDCAPADQDQPAFWVGHNSLKHHYDTQGANAQQVAGVEMKSSMWTYEIPSSVTPENISYPFAGVDMYPFYNWNGAHAEYTINQVAAISTSLAKGPNPVERIQLFADDPTLVSND